MTFRRFAPIFGILTLLGVVAKPLPAYEYALTTWLANAPVKAAVSSGNTVFIGGEFYQIGPYTGGGALVDATSGTIVASAPNVLGFVYAVLADGSGGWYLGGSFSQVAGANRLSVAHLLANGTVDPNFIANLNSSGEAYKFYLSGSTLYVGGFFNTVNGTSRMGLAAVDKATGNVVSAFDAGLSDSVFDMVPGAGSTLYIAGFFQTVANGSTTRNRIAQVNLSNGSATTFNPNANQRVTSLLLNGSTLYAGGRFTSIGGQARTYLAALDASGSTGWATTFDAAATLATGTDVFQVQALALSSTTLVVGGRFDDIGGQTRPNLTALDANSGTGLSWDPGCDDMVWGLTISAGTVYVAGEFRQIGTLIRNHLAALDLASNTATAWDPNAGAWCWALAPYGSSIFVGGTFRSIGGVKRENLAAIDAISGTPTAFDPGFLVGPTDSFVHALAVSGASLYFGGEFTEVSGTTRNHLAAVDTVTGNLLPFDPDADGLVRALAVSGTVLYAGGDFANIGGQGRVRIAGLDTSNGLANSFNPNADGSVISLALGPNRVYAGGNFLNIGGLARSYLAALDPALGAAYPGFDPSPNGSVGALLTAGNSLYVGGSFVSISNVARQRLAALEPLSGSAQAFNAGVVDGNVNALALNLSTLYAGGNFNQAGGFTRFYLAALNASTGLATAFSSSTNGVINAIANVGSTVFVGGSFSRAFGFIQYNLSATVDNPPTPTPTVVIVHPNEVAAYPQPAKEQICFSVWADAPGEVQIDAYNLAFQHVATFKSNLAGSGQQSFCESTGPLASGVYLYKTVLNGKEYPYKKFWVIR